MESHQKNFNKLFFLVNYTKEAKYVNTGVENNQTLAEDE